MAETTQPNPTPVRSTAYGKGLSDGKAGRAYDPLWNYQPDEKEDYRAGFTKAREHLK